MNVMNDQRDRDDSGAMGVRRGPHSGPPVHQSLVSLIGPPSGATISGVNPGGSASGSAQSARFDVIPRPANVTRSVAAWYVAGRPPLPFW